MRGDLVISFGNSRSPAFQSVVNQAKHFKGYKYENEEHLIYIPANEIIELLDQINILYRKIKNWKSTIISLNGKVIDFEDFNHFEDVYYCHRFEKDCKKLNMTDWGCSLLWSVRLFVQSYYLDKERYWFNIGYFDDEEYWNIDKQRLYRMLKEEAEQKKLHLCPLFSLETIKKKIDELPDKIDLVNHPHFRIIYEKQFDGIKETENPYNIELIDHRTLTWKIEAKHNLNRIQNN